jgi:hypothetical protein
MQFNETKSLSTVTFQFVLFVKVYDQTWILTKEEKADPDEF